MHFVLLRPDACNTITRKGRRLSYNGPANIMETTNFDPHEFYTKQGQISDPGRYADHFNDLPEELPELVRAIQGLMLHLHWADRYGITLNRIRKEESNLRTVKDRLARIFDLSEKPLDQERPLSSQTVGTCRDFALLLTSILRHRGIPARSRAGFGTYFTQDLFEDHWVCEYWQADENRWIMVDPQLDSLQIEALSISFNPLDMPKTKFVTGPQAWLRCRAKRVNPSRFGIFRMRGLDFVKGNLIRDFLALNKMEILPWDNFMAINTPFRKMNADEKALMDRLARIASGEDRDFILLRAAFSVNRDSLLPKYF